MQDASGRRGRLHRLRERAPEILVPQRLHFAAAAVHQRDGGERAHHRGQLGQAALARRVHQPRAQDRPHPAEAARHVFGLPHETAVLRVAALVSQ